MIALYIFCGAAAVRVDKRTARISQLFMTLVLFLQKSTQAPEWLDVPRDFSFMVSDNTEHDQWAAFETPVAQNTDHIWTSSHRSQRFDVTQLLVH
jgi:hypothetical protein